MGSYGYSGYYDREYDDPYYSGGGTRMATADEGGATSVYVADIPLNPPSSSYDDDDRANGG